MSNALFLPRELFSSPAPAVPTPLDAGVRPSQGAFFASGEAVAADLLSGLTPLDAAIQPNAERRRKPRPLHARGVDLYIA